MKKIKENADAAEVTSTVESYAAKVLEVPAEVRKIMQETRNEEKVEKIEQEKRASNIIIHGAEEVGEGNEEIKKNDDEYIKEVWKQLKVTSLPATITRLGQPNDQKSRAIKLVMKSKAEKEQVMANLGKLKGTEREFGKISVTHDYTSSDREKIRKFTHEARLKSEADPSRVFNVRGDPKNGLRIISYLKP